MSWLTNLLLSRYVKGLLDKLPLDGYKSALSFVGFLLFTAAGVLCVANATTPACLIIGSCSSVLHSLGIENFTTDAAVSFLGTTILFLFHKALKLLEKKTDSGLPPAKV